MSGVLSRLPNLNPVTEFRETTRGGFQNLVDQLGEVGSTGSGSTLASLLDLVGQLHGRLAVDSSGIDQLGAALETIEHALPDGSLGISTLLESTFAAAHRSLAASPLARGTTEGSSLQDTAVLFIETALDSFRQQQAELDSSLTDTNALKRVSSTLAALEGFRTDFAGHAAEFGPFIAEHVLGFSASVFDEPLAKLDAVLAVYRSIDATSIEASLGTALRALGDAQRTALEAIDSFDPNSSAALDAVAANVASLGSAAQQVMLQLTGSYRTLRAAIDTHPWGTSLEELARALAGLRIPAPFSVDNLFEALSDTVGQLIERVQTFFGPDHLVAPVLAVPQPLIDLLSPSPVARVGEILREILGSVLDALGAIPFEQVLAEAEHMLGGVRDAIESMNIDQVGETVERALNEAEEFIVSQMINNDFGAKVKAAGAELGQLHQNLPVQELVDAIGRVTTELEGLIMALEASLGKDVSGANELLAKLEALSFRPVADVVIDEIGTVSQKLRHIDPNALSEIEKTALRESLAVVTALDLEGTLIGGLKANFRDAGADLRGLLGDLGVMLGRLKEALTQYLPEPLFKPLLLVLDEAVETAERLNTTSPMRPIYDAFHAGFQKFPGRSPGAALRALDEPFRKAIARVDRADPTEWLEPLRAAHAAILHLVDIIDVTPRLTELEARRDAFLVEAQNAILSSLAAVNPPEPVRAFVDTLRPFVVSLAGALFANLETELHRIREELRASVRPSTLVTPLNRAFDELRDLLQGIPMEPHVEAFELIRKEVNAGRSTLDPRHIEDAFAAGAAAADALGPDNVLAPFLGLTTLRTSFEARVTGAPEALDEAVTRVRAELDSWLGSEGAAPVLALEGLRAEHRALMAALQAQIAALDFQSLHAASAELDENLERVVPAFLREPMPLVVDDILQGIESLRPTRWVAPADWLVDDFSTRLAPLQAALQDPANALSRSLRSAFDLIDPMILRDALMPYGEIRQKLASLDPMALAEAFRGDVFKPVRAALGELVPLRWEARLDQAYQRVLAQLTGTTEWLDEIRDILGAEFGRFGKALQTDRTTFERALGRATEEFTGVLDRVERIALAELLERLNRVLENLETAFARELDRVCSAFNQMAAAIPLTDARPARSARNEGVSA